MSLQRTSRCYGAYFWKKKMRVSRMEMDYHSHGRSLQGQSHWCCGILRSEGNLQAVAKHFACPPNTLILNLSSHLMYQLLRWKKTNL